MSVMILAALAALLVARPVLAVHDQPVGGPQQPGSRDAVAYPAPAPARPGARLDG